MKKILSVSLVVLIGIAGVLLYAYHGTWGKVDIEFRIHINEELVRETVYGEPPTFAIWLENSQSGQSQTVFATRRAATGDWEGKAEVPVALPLWFEIYKKENAATRLPTFDQPAPIAVTGATPKPGYFITRVRVDEGSEWNCWIEMNLSGDYNEIYRQFDPVTMEEDAFGSGQPALVYKAHIRAEKEEIVIPEIVGMSVINVGEKPTLKPLKGITTASDVFDEITIFVVKPKPKIIDR